MAEERKGTPVKKWDEVNGCLTEEVAVQDASQAPITVSTALISFFNGLNGLGDVCSRIDAIERGYMSTASLSGTMTLTPVWRITTDTGSYQLDTMSGGLTRLSL